MFEQFSPLAIINKLTNDLAFFISSSETLNLKIFSES